MLIKTLLIKHNQKREAALKNEAGRDEKRVFFLLGLSDGENLCPLWLVIPKYIEIVSETFSNCDTDRHEQ